MSQRTTAQERVENPEALMRQYKRSGDVETRNRLVLHYAPHISAAIYNMRSILLSRIPFEEFYNQGIITLIECIEKYDPNRGASFDTYIYKAVRGAALNYMRKQNWLPNRVQEVRRDIAKAQAELRQTLMREPTDRELGEALGISEQRLGLYLVEIASTESLSLEDLLEQSGEAVLDRSDTADGGGVADALMREELTQILAQAIEALPPKQRQIITLCYYENLNLREIGEVLGLTQQRISQIRTDALGRLNQALRQYINS